MIGVLLAIALLQDSQTQCHQNIIGMPSSGITCETTSDDPAPLQTAVRTEESVCTRVDWFLLGCSKERHEFYATRQKRAQEIGALIADGKCGDAVNVALRAGDLDFAKKIKDFCSTSGPQSTQGQ